VRVIDLPNPDHPVARRLNANTLEQRVCCYLEAVRGAVDS